MALFFDLATLERETAGDAAYLVHGLEHWYNRRTIAKNSRERYKPIQKPMHGHSFLLNPGDFFADRSTDILFKAQYIRLAGRRDYLLYKNYGVAYLDLSYYPDINAAIKYNPLLTIQNNHAYFKYEEKLKNGSFIQTNQR